VTEDFRDGMALKRAGPRLALRHRGRSSGAKAERSDFRRARPVLPSEKPIEVGQVAKPRLIGDRADCPVALVPSGQKLMGARQSRAAYEIGERCSFRGKKHAQILRREAMTFGNGGFRQAIDISVMLITKRTSSLRQVTVPSCAFSNQQARGRQGGRA
jgi:hypothetical protein